VAGFISWKLGCKITACRCKRNVQWAANGVSVGIAAGNQTSPKNVSDGWGGSIYAWQDKRGSNFDIYAHHLFTDGSPVGMDEENIFSRRWFFQIHFHNQQPFN
jgi:hypothetical protein